MLTWSKLLLTIILRGIFGCLKPKIQMTLKILVSIGRRVEAWMKTRIHNDLQIFRTDMKKGKFKTHKILQLTFTKSLFTVSIRKWTSLKIVLLYLKLLSISSIIASSRSWTPNKPLKENIKTTIQAFTWLAQLMVSVYNPIAKCKYKMVKEISSYPLKRGGVLQPCKRTSIK